MMMATEHLYIVRDELILGGEPIIKGTRTPVRSVVEMWRMGMPPEEMLAGLPHLTLAQIYDAMSYFADHKEEILDHIERNRIPNELIDPRVRHL